MSSFDASGFPAPPDLTPYHSKLHDQYLAAGRFGDVFKCLYSCGSPVDVKEVAVKALRFKFNLKLTVKEGDRSAKKFRRELEIWKLLDHRNIVPFLGIADGSGMRGSMSLMSLWMPNDTIQNFLTKHDCHLVIDSN
ncbi:hypothetical protein OG21DRAFT_357461 [Imleria badia]|nr:hypothetical protein OG21DRAFT_357461 [Imleria badia]